MCVCSLKRPKTIRDSSSPHANCGKIASHERLPFATGAYHIISCCGNGTIVLDYTRYCYQRITNLAPKQRWKITLGVLTSTNALQQPRYIFWRYVENVIMFCRQFNICFVVRHLRLIQRSSCGTGIGSNCGASKATLKFYIMTPRRFEENWKHKARKMYSLIFYSFCVREFAGHNKNTGHFKQYIHFLIFDHYFSKLWVLYHRLPTILDHWLPIAADKLAIRTSVFAYV